MKKILKLATSYIHKGKSTTCFIFVAGFFYACILKICGSVLPCKSVMGLLPLWCMTTGKAEPFFFFSPYITLCKMSYTEKNYVADSQLAKTTPLHVVDHHAQNFYNTIKNFYSFANPSDFIEANNDLLNTYLEKGLDEEEGFTPKHLQNIVFMVNLQNQFLTALKENFETLKQSINQKSY